MPPPTYMNGWRREPSLSGWFLKTLAVIFLMQVAVNGIRPTVSYRALALGADATQLGLITAAFALLSFIFAIPGGRMIDKRGEMPFIILGLGFVTGVAFGLIVATSIWALFLAQAFLGLGQVFSTVGMQALIANSDPAHRDSRFGTFTVVISLGQLLGPAASGVLNQHVGFPHMLETGSGLVGGSVFVASGLTAFVGCLLALSARSAGSTERGDKEPPSQPSTSVLHSVGRVLRQPNAPHAMFASIAALTTTDLLIAYLPAYGQATGLSATTVGLLLSARAGASMLSRLFMVKLIRIAGHGRLLVLCTALPALCLSLLPLANALPLIFALIAAAGFGLGLGQPLSLTWIASTAPEDIRGTAVGVRLSGNRLGQVAVPALVGGVIGTGGTTAIFIAVAGMLAGSAVVSAYGSFATAD